MRSGNWGSAEESVLTDEDASSRRFNAERGLSLRACSIPSVGLFRLPSENSAYTPASSISQSVRRQVELTHVSSPRLDCETHLVGPLQCSAEPFLRVMP